jgi:hypothetical protein
MALMRTASVLVLALGLVTVAGCAARGGGGDGPAVFSSQSNASGGFNPFRRGNSGSANTASIGVNGYLWRATLDTLSFMPLASADPYGGVVITDWYTAAETPNERFKVTVYILDTRLRADGLNVTVSKQSPNGAGGWVDTAASPQTETDLENAILTRARQLRLSNIQ